MCGRGAWRTPALLALIGAGCSLGPRQFRDVHDPAPLVRARAAGLTDELPREAVVPDLIDRLGDADAVVRLSAHEELRRRTGKDFGYRAWDDAPERDAAAGRWRAWWAAEPASGLAPPPEPAGGPAT
jgi:HEAT repeat protein